MYDCVALTNKGVKVFILKETLGREKGINTHRIEFENTWIAKSLECEQLNAVHEMFFSGESLIQILKKEQMDVLGFMEVKGRALTT